MDIPYLIQHPEELNQETLYDLRRIVAVHPTYHAARILFLQNLFLLHDTTFDQELRKAALLVPDRRVLCQITKFGGLKSPEESQKPTPAETPQTQPEGGHKKPIKKYASDTTSRILDDLLDTAAPAPLPRRRIKADPATDYMAYLMQEEEAAPAEESSLGRLDTLIDGFITSYESGIKLSENPSTPEGILDDPDELQEEEETTAAEPVATTTEAEPEPESKTLTQTLANIYIKQGKYERALDILTRMNANPATATPYSADQIRFLQKLLIVSKSKKAKE